jgi:DEAD/DEAH box helicase domain-containing protein
VDRLDTRKRRVTVSRATPNYFTRVRSQKTTNIIDREDGVRYRSAAFHFGRIKVTDHVYGYEVVRVRDRAVLERVPLETPPHVFETQALWITLPRDIGTRLGRRVPDLMGGIHAVEHAAISMFPFLVMADRNDIGGLATEYHDQTGGPTIFIYDGFPGGVGLSRQAYRLHRRLIELTLNALLRCPCETGCPACIQSPKCGNGNRPLDKSAAIRILDCLQETPGTEKKQDVDLRHRGPKPVKPARTPPRRRSPSGAYGVFDLETQLSAAEVGGWQFADRMKVSCGVLYDSRQDRFLEFTDRQVGDLIQHLKTLDLIIGFNIKRFDYRVLGGYSRVDFNRFRNLDILEVVHRYLGCRLSLNHLARTTLNEPKTADGLQALTWWREGRMRELMAYCRHDVRLTRDLYLFGRRHGYLLFRDKAERVLRIPVEWA